MLRHERPFSATAKDRGVRTAAQKRTPVGVAILGHPARVQIRVGLCNSTWQKFVIAVTKFFRALEVMSKKGKAGARAPNVRVAAAAETAAAAALGRLGSPASMLMDGTAAAAEAAAGAVGAPAGLPPASLTVAEQEKVVKDEMFKLQFLKDRDRLQAQMDELHAAHAAREAGLPPPSASTPVVEEQVRSAPAASATVVPVLERDVKRGRQLRRKEGKRDRSPSSSDSSDEGEDSDESEESGSQDSLGDDDDSSDSDDAEEWARLRRKKAKKDNKPSRKGKKADLSFTVKQALKHWRREAKLLGDLDKMEMRRVLRLLRRQRHTVSREAVEGFLEELHFMWVRATAGFEVAERFKINQANDSEVGVDMKAFALATKQVAVSSALRLPKNGEGSRSHPPRAQKKSKGRSKSSNASRDGPAAQRVCFRCQKPGHISKDCSMPMAVAAAKVKVKKVEDP